MNIFLDHKKSPYNPDNFIIIKNIEDFKKIIKTEKVDLISMSHDFMESDLGLQAANFLIANNIFVQYVNLHEFSKTKSFLIKSRLEKKFPSIIITMNNKV